MCQACLWPCCCCQKLKVSYSTIPRALWFPRITSGKRSRSYFHSVRRSFSSQTCFVSCYLPRAATWLRFFIICWLSLMIYFVVVFSLSKFSSDPSQRVTQNLAWQCKKKKEKSEQLEPEKNTFHWGEPNRRKREFICVNQTKWKSFSLFSDVTLTARILVHSHKARKEEAFCGWRNGIWGNWGCRVGLEHVRTLKLDSDACGCIGVGMDCNWIEILVLGWIGLVVEELSEWALYPLHMLLPVSIVRIDLEFLIIQNSL